MSTKLIATIIDPSNTVLFNKAYDIEDAIKVDYSATMHGKRLGLANLDSSTFVNSILKKIYAEIGTNVESVSSNRVNIELSVNDILIAKERIEHVAYFINNGGGGYVDAHGNIVPIVEMLELAIK